jgi:hypothetical protein
MKKLLIASVIMLGLSGCSLLDAYLMTHYDPNEYKLITEIRAQARSAKAECDDAIVSRANAYKLAYDTQLFAMYSEHIPRNKELVESSTSLRAIAQGLADQYSKSDKVSPTFCKIKFDTLETSANKMQTVIAGRPR